MKRDRRLRYLSEDHHYALVVARRAIRAGNREGTRSAQEVWAEVLERFEHDLAPHFAIEEQLILPALEAKGEVALAQRTRSEHTQLRALAAEETESIEARLSLFGAALRDHVRFEERVLFTVVQNKIDDAVLDAVAAACKPLAKPPRQLTRRAASPRFGG